MASRLSADVSYMRSNLGDKSFKQNAKNKLGDVRLKLNKAEDLCQVLLEENNNLSEEVTILRSRFHDTQQCIDHFSNEKEEVCKDLSDLKTLLVDREREFMAEKGKLENDKMSVTLTLERLRNEMRKLREENEDSKQRLVVMDSALQTRNKEGEILQQEKAALTETMVKKSSALEQQVAKLQRERDEAKATTDDTEKNCSTFKAQIERAKGQLDATIKWNKTLTESKDRLRKEYQQVTESLSALKVEYDVYRTDTQQKLEEVSQRLVTKEKEMVGVIREKNRLETNLEDVKKKLRMSEEKRDKLSCDLQANKEKAQKQRSEKEAEISKLIEYSKGKEKLLKQSETLISNKEQELHKLKEQLDDLKEQGYKLMKEKNALKEKQERSELLLREWSQKYDSLEKAKEETDLQNEEQLTILKNDLEEVQAECSQYARDNKDLGETIADLTNENTDLHQSLKNFEANTALLKRDVIELHEKKKKFDEDLKVLTARKNNLEREKDEVTATKDLLAQENSNLKVHQEEILSEYEKQKKELEIVIKVKNEIKKDLENTKQHLSETKVQHEEKEVHFDRIKSELSKDLELNKSKLNQTKKEMDLAKKSFEQEKAELSVARDITTQENENLKAHQDEVMAEMEKMKKEFDILIVLKNDMKRDMERSKLDLDEAKRIQEQTEKDCQEIKADIERECATYKNLAKEATQETERCQKQFDNEKKSLKKSVADLEDQIIKKDEVLTELSKKCEVVEEELVKEQACKVDRQAPSSEWLEASEEIGLFRPRDGSTPVAKTPLPEQAVPQITIGDEHKEMINKLQTRWDDVMVERKHIKEAMTNFYSLIDVLIKAKDRLQDALTEQKEEFERKLEEVSNQSQASERPVYYGTAPSYDSPYRPDDGQDPRYVEANINELLRETNLYEGHIEYLKHQIGSHYGKAAKALDKHKNTMQSALRMPNGQSLISNAVSVKSSRLSNAPSMSSLHDQDSSYISESGLKSLSDKHFQMINELSNLRKQLSDMKDEHSRLRMENKYLRDSDSRSRDSLNGSFRGTRQYPGSMSGTLSPVSPVYSPSAPIAVPLTSTYPARNTPRIDDVTRSSRAKRDTDSRYKAAVEALRSELRIT